MNNIALGQYIDRNSLIHRLDPRTKILSLIIMMVTAFLIPRPFTSSVSWSIEYPWIPFIGLGVIFIFLLVVIFLSNISIWKYLKSIRQILFIVLFTFILHIFTSKNEEFGKYDINLYFTYIGIIVGVILLVLFFVFRKHLPSKMFLFILLLALIVYLFTFDIGPNVSSSMITIYKSGIYTGAYNAALIYIVIMLSTTLTLTTKPTDLTNALEWILHPLTFIKVNVSIFAMMTSLALRFIPTLFNETNKILKAQSSRGVDFKEGNLISQVKQIVSLLIPMFVISYKRAADLADAMEARAYIPGEKRTKLNILKFKFSDYCGLIISAIYITAVIVIRIVGF